MLNFFYLLLISSIAVLSSSTYAYETDQYETVGIDLKDATGALNTLIQAEIEEVVDLWQGKERDDAELAFDISSRFSRRQLEVWGVDSPHLESYSSGHNSIYNNVSPFYALMQYSKGLAPTVSVDDVHIGLDKLTHFFGVGALYLHVARQFENIEKGERAAIDFGMKVERTYWGTMTTGVYSNADMVANYEGFRFLKGLFANNTVPGKPALLVWDKKGPRLQRAFDIRDYVNDYWNEVFNPNSFAETMSDQIIESLEYLCDKESETGLFTSYISANDQQLSSRYRGKGLRSDRENFLLPKICGSFYKLSPQEKEKHRQKYNIKPYNFYTLPINNLGLRSGLKKIKQSISSPLCHYQVRMAEEEHKLLLKTYESDSPAVWDKLEMQMKSNDSIIELAGGLQKVNAIKPFKDDAVFSNNILDRHYGAEARQQCYVLDVVDPDNIIRKGFTLQIRLCLEKKDDGSWHRHKQYVVSYEDSLQMYLQDLDPIMLNFFDAQFTHYSSNTLDYFSWDQRMGYVYRTISPLCRWF